MAEERETVKSGNSNGGSTLPPSASLRFRLVGVVIRLTRLWPEMRRFGRWLETEAFPAAGQAGEDQLHLELAEGGRIEVLGTPQDLLPPVPEGLGRVARLLTGMGIGQLRLDRRLESNQVGDVLILLLANRSGIRRAGAGRSPGGAAGRIVSDEGVPFACTRTRVAEGTLEVTYSYCTTRFSQFVRWFVRSSHRFADHRALFHAAPRWAMLLGSITVGPFLIYSFYEQWWLLLVVTAIGGGTVFASVYVFFMIVGSMEYDNEEKSHRLSSAYAKLDRYARRIQDDLRRAQTVQERTLPDPSHMPMSDRLDWASSFVPAEEVGGDLFDAAVTGDGQVTILFGDVSGHGMAAAMVTAIMTALFREWVERGGPLDQFVDRLNQHLGRLTPDDSFAAVFLATYDAQTGQMCYINGGHHPEPWRIPAGPDQPIGELSEGRATLLGVVDDIGVRSAGIVLEPGDTVLLATDGLVEARNCRGQMYSVDRLAACLQQHRGESVRQMVQQVVQDVDRFTCGAEQTDDCTVLAFRVKSDGKP